jgi:type I restriction enzyme S subunit
MADTIAVMRKRVLDMAIRGELVEQRPEEGTGKELYRDIEQEKDQLMKSGKIKKEKNFPLVSKKEEPFEIPINWTWVRLGSLTAAEDDSFSDGPFGSNLKTIHYTENPEVRIIQLNNVGEGIWKDKVRKYTTYQHAAVLKRYNIKPGDMVIAKMMPAGRTIIVPEVEDRYIVSSDNVKFVPNKKVNSTYIMHTVNSSTIRQMIVNTSTGTTRLRTSSSKLKNLFVPLPPLAEQKRIVAKIEDIFAIIDQIGTKKEEALSIIRNMRQTALQYAITGMLAEQYDTDEPASVLYEKIQAKKEQMVKEKKIKKEKPLSDIEASDIPFEIPNSWKWVRLKEVVYNHGQKKPDTTFSYIDIGSINNKYTRLNAEEKIIKPEDAPSRARKIVKMGDILYSTVRPYLHNACIIDREFSEEPIASTGFAVIKTHSGLLNKFLFHYLLSPTFDLFANDTSNATGTAYPAINDTKLYQAVIPLPPLAEQERIVAKLDEIMAICDQMESILNENSEVNIALKVAE